MNTVTKRRVAVLGAGGVSLGLMVAAVWIFYPRRISTTIDMVPFGEAFVSGEAKNELLQTLGSEAFRRDLLSRLPRRVRMIERAIKRWSVHSTQSGLLLEIEAGPLNLLEKRALDELVQEWVEECRLAVALTVLRDNIRNGGRVIIWDSTQRPFVQMTCILASEGKVGTPGVVRWNATRTPKTLAVRGIVFEIEEMCPGYYLDLFWD